MCPIINSDGSESCCGYDYDYEEVETLSFCDLPIYSSSGGGASFESKDQEEHNSLTSDYQEDDFFEFLSGNLDSSSTAWDIDNVIFCGKLIPYHQTPEQVHQIVNNKNENVPVKKQRQRFFQWNLRKSTIESSSTDGKKTRKCGVASASANSKKLAAAGELILASPTRAKWHLFLFGLTKNPTAIELSEMKNRQHHRRTPSSSLKYQSFDETKKGKGVTGNTKKKTISSRGVQR